MPPITTANRTVMQYESFSPDDGGIRNENIFSTTSVSTGRRKLITEYKGYRLSCNRKASSGICSPERSLFTITCAESSSHAPLLSKFVLIASFDAWRHQFDFMCLVAPHHEIKIASLMIPGICCYIKGTI